jgi:hypothetical protein
MAKMPKRNQSRNTSRNYKSDKTNGITRVTVNAEVGSGAEENVSNVIIMQKANTKSKVAQHEPLDKCKDRIRYHGGVTIFC